jgi:hypothetical protein
MLKDAGNSQFDPALSLSNRGVRETRMIHPAYRVLSLLAQKMGAFHSWREKKAVVKCLHTLKHLGCPRIMTGELGQALQSVFPKHCIAVDLFSYGAKYSWWKKLSEKIVAKILGSTFGSPDFSLS